MKKRLLAVLLATAMATTMLAGCGDKTDNRSSVEDDDDDDDEDDGDDAEVDIDDEDDDDNIVAVVDDDFSIEISSDSILYGLKPDIRMFYGNYWFKGDSDDPDYYEDIKELASGVMTLTNSYWDYKVDVYNFPSKIVMGKLGSFFTPSYWSDDLSSISYAEGQYYSGIVGPNELNVLKYDLVNKYGDQGIRYYGNALKSYELTFALISFPEADSPFDEEFGAVVELDGNKLTFYNYRYNDDQTVDVLDEFYHCYVDFDGINLEVGSNGSIAELVPFDFRSGTDYIASYAFVENKGAACDGLSGFFFVDDDMDGYGKLLHGYMSNGNESYEFNDNQDFIYSAEDGTFSTSYYVNVVNSANGVVYLEDEESEHKSIDGRFLWCGDQGMIFRVGNEMYYYIYSADNYYADVYGNNGMPQDNGNGATYADSVNTHTQVSQELNDAFGDEAEVDDNSGAVTMESSVLFDVNSTEISEEGKTYLDAFIVTYMNTMKPYLENGSVTAIIVEGHTDPDGSFEYNLDLSERRAQAVADYMIACQPELAPYVTTVGYSYLYPVLDDSGNVDKAASRRVVFSFSTE